MRLGVSGSLNLVGLGLVVAPPGGFEVRVHRGPSDEWVTRAAVVEVARREAAVSREREAEHTAIGDELLNGGYMARAHERWGLAEHHRLRAAVLDEIVRRLTCAD